MIRYSYRCPACGNTGEIDFPDDSHEGEAAACAAPCGELVTLTRDASPPLWPEGGGGGGAGYVVRWWDESMSASSWWNSPGVEPEQAAQVLWRINPDDEPDGMPASDEDRRAYRALLREFRTYRQTNPGPITLAQWLDIARQKSLRYHSWIADWLRARAEIAAADWRDQARQIADECFDRDTANHVRDSLIGYSRRVMTEMTTRQIHGPRGPIDNASTVQREALQGAKWWAGKPKE